MMTDETKITYSPHDPDPGEPKGILRIEQETVEVTTWGGPVPDPDWTFTDAAGHRHQMSPEGKYEDRWPSLRWVVDETWWCEDCGDNHEEGHWECAVCGEVIEPGMKPSPGGVKRRPGVRHYILDGKPISADEAAAFLDELAKREA